MQEAVSEPLDLHPEREIEGETSEERAHRQSKERQNIRASLNRKGSEESPRRGRKRDKIAKAFHLRKSGNLSADDLPVHPRVLQLNQLKQQQDTKRLLKVDPKNPQQPPAAAQYPHPKPRLQLSGDIPFDSPRLDRGPGLSKISSRALERGPDRTIKEDEVDEIILKLADISYQGLMVTKHRKLFKSYPDSFSGKDLVTWLCAEFGWSREKALEKGQTILLNRHVFYPLSTVHQSLHDKKSHFYRFKFMENPHHIQILNEIKTYHEDVEDPVKLSEELVDMVIGLMMIPHSEDDLSSIRDSRMFRRFWLRTCRLQKVRIERMSNLDKIVFFANLHNLLMAHNAILNGPPRTRLDTKQAMTKTYRVGQHEYSLQLIKLILSGQVPENESVLPVEDVQLHPLNPLVHFCLFTGTKDSPAIRSYSVADFEEMCIQQAKLYLSEHLEIRSEFNQVWIPRMLAEHVTEFASSERGMLEIFARYLPKPQRLFIQSHIDQLAVKYKDTSFQHTRFIKEAVIGK